MLFRSAVTPPLAHDVGAAEMEAALEALPSIVDVSVSRAQRRGTVNGFVYSVTFHEVNYNHTASQVVGHQPLSWTKRSAALSGAYLSHGDVPMLVPNASGLLGTHASAVMREIVTAATTDAGGVVALDVTQNGQDFSAASGVVFEYLPIVRVRGLMPNHGPLHGEIGRASCRERV